MAKDPAMPFYVNDYLSSPRVEMMTAEQERGYFRLILRCWASGDASLPDDDQALSVLSKMGEGWFNGGCDLVRVCFEPHPEKKGSITHPKTYDLWKERQEWREKSRLGGIKSGKTRAKASKGGSRKDEPKGNSSSSSSFSILTSSSGVDWKEAGRKANEISIIFGRCISDRDRRLVLGACSLAQQSPLNSDWLDDAIVLTREARPDNPYAYLKTVLIDSSRVLGVDFNQSIAKIPKDRFGKRVDKNTNGVL